MLNKKYYDCNNVEYTEGDIVCNQSFGDYWVVRKLTPKQMKELDIDTELALVLWDDMNEYIMAIDEPTGFLIVHRKDEIGYDLALAEIHQYIENIHKQEEESINGNV